MRLTFLTWPLPPVKTKAHRSSVSQAKKLAHGMPMVYRPAIRVDTLGGNAEWSGPVFHFVRGISGCFMSFAGA